MAVSVVLGTHLRSMWRCWWSWGRTKVLSGSVGGPGEALKVYVAMLVVLETQ